MRLSVCFLLACTSEPVDSGTPTDSGDDTADSGDVAQTAPVVTFLQPTGTQFAVGEAIPFEAQLADAEDDPARLDVTWTGADGTTYLIDNTPVPAGHLEGELTLEAEGDYTITLTATDPAGNVGSASVQFSVIIPDALPECTILNPAAGELVREGEDVLLAGEVDDAETAAGDLLVVWSSTLGGELGESVAVGEGTVSLLTELEVGDQELSLTVTDEAGGECVDTIAIRVNGTPDVEIDTPHRNDVVNEGELVSFTGTVSDDRESPAELGCVWYDETTRTNLDYPTPDAGGAVAFSTADLAVGEHKVWLGAEDLDGTQGWDSVTFTVNDLPSAPTVSITGTDALEATLDVESTDAEADPITYTYAWTLDGIPYPAVGATIAESDTTSGQVWAVVVTPNDGYGDGDPGSASTTVP